MYLMRAVIDESGTIINLMRMHDRSQNGRDARVALSAHPTYSYSYLIRYEGFKKIEYVTVTKSADKSTVLPS